MKKAIKAILIATMICNSKIEIVNARTIIDMAGRTLEIPKEIKSVYSTSPMSQILMYTLAPSKITGRVYLHSEQEKRFLIDEYINKPVLGGWYGKNTTGNPEAIIKAKPDIIVSMGDIDETNKSFSNRLQQQLNIPVIMIDGKLSKSDTVYRFLGNLIGEKTRAETLAVYCRNTFEKVNKVIEKIPQGNRIRVYYAEGLEGLETDPKGSLHAELLDLAGGKNVAEVPNVGGYGRASVSIEQLLVWNPDMIIVCIDQGVAKGDQNYYKITSNYNWNSLAAVKKSRVYKIPSVPFGWFDRPPSINRIIGLQWLVQLLYPDNARIDIRKETVHFYKLFYHCQLNEKELDEVLDHAIEH